MFGVITKPDTRQKLEILSKDGQYDLACACGCQKEEHRKRSEDGKWIYPVTLPSGGKSTLFKTLISNVCTSDCKYCPLREQMDIRRCSLGSDQIAKVFMDYYQQKKVFGLFLSSSVTGSADAAMKKLIATAEILRKKYQYRGYIHLKVIPGASEAAIVKAVSLSSAVSINIETPGEKNLSKLTNKKDYIKDIIKPMKLISNLTCKGSKYSRVKQTTQFIVGAACETDGEIVKYLYGLYDRLKLQRVYFSAYQKGLGDGSLPAENRTHEDYNTPFIREHRLYQVDFLFRKYGFKETDIGLDSNGNLSIDKDPKQIWADRHPEFFPVNINTADKNALLRVPGLGPVTVNRILYRRRNARLREIADAGKVNKTLQKASEYLRY